MNAYARFGAMIATSTAVMFGLMYLNTYQFDHVFFSETRLYMAFVMGATMAVIMLGYMLGMYKNPRANLAIIIGSVVVFALSLWLVRSQATVEDVAWIKAMIPHHEAVPHWIDTSLAPVHPNDRGIAAQTRGGARRGPCPWCRWMGRVRGLAGLA